jgi:hypothetical protein
MIRQLFSLASLAATLLLPALTGCAYLHKETPAPVPITTLAPSPAPAVTPLYSQLAEGGPTLPDLPTPPPPGAQPAPPPTSIIGDSAKKPARNGHHRGHKSEVEVAERDTHEHEAREKEPAPVEVATATPPPEGQNVKVTAPTPSGDTTQSTSIGILTAGTAPDNTGSRQQAADLIDSTSRGVNSLHNLKGDQNKTVAQIHSFLDQAQRALHNGDVDGANTLATKAKTLLDELTGAS